MSKATITLHLPAYRARALQLQADPREAEPAYDENIEGYLQFLAQEAAKAGLVLATDHGELSAYSIHAADHDAKRAAHDWLDTQPDIWNWMP